MDDELELQNFKKVAEVLAVVWTDHVIDDHPVTAGSKQCRRNLPQQILDKGSCMNAQYILHTTFRPSACMRANKGIQ